VALALQVGSTLTLSPLPIREAAVAAWESYAQLRAELEAGGATPTVRRRAAGTTRSQDGAATDGTVVGVVGHPYNLYDPFVNHSLLDRLARLGTTLVTPERLGVKPGADYWSFEYEVVGAAKAAVAQPGMSGIVAVVAFGCGPDSVMQEQVREIGARAGVPVMVLALDEHAGEAGLLTRLEAFIDMLRWRKRRDEPVPRD
jgi:predicted nucleotide-binding protein (sugar kinase/HSP70/actin superfamily)